MFLVGQNDWHGASSIIKSALITSIALTSFYVLSIQVFNQDEIITKNLNNYVELDNLQLEIFNYCGTYPNTNSEGDTLSFNEFHTHVVERLVLMNEIYVEFNEETIEASDYSKILDGSE
ncbi:MAG: hypothetical protein HRT57_04475 [Crocinitomicaceae bacterium]|nr:hypothetical protein [Crocinitomicaceae bacterium]